MSKEKVLSIEENLIIATPETQPVTSPIQEEKQDIQPEPTPRPQAEPAETEKQETPDNAPEETTPNHEPEQSATYKKLLKAMQALNAAKKENNHLKVETAMQKAKEAAKAVNVESLDQAVSDIISKGKTDAEIMTYYLNHYHYTYTAVGAKPDKDSGLYVLRTKEATISLPALSKGKDSLLPDGHFRHIQALLYNLYRHIASTVNEKVKTVSLSDDVRSFITKNSYDSYSINRLEKQLNDTLTYLLPDGLSIKVLKKDVRYLIHALTKASDGRIEIKKESTFLNELVVVMHHRLNGLDYAIESKAAVFNTK